jgi:hypothetical protein
VFGRQGDKQWALGGKMTIDGAIPVTTTAPPKEILLKDTTQKKVKGSGQASKL